MGKLLTHFKDLISTDVGQVVTRQYFFVTFDGPDVDSLGFPTDLGLYVQNFDLPNLALDDEGAVIIKNPRGTYQVPGNGLVIPEANTFTIDFLETEDPVIETYFVPWLEKVVNIRESNRYPFPRATVRVDVLSTLNPEDIVLTYEFHGAYPSLITLPTFGQALKSEITRPVQFSFDRTKVTWQYSNLKSQEDSTVSTPEERNKKQQEQLNAAKNKTQPTDVNIDSKPQTKQLDFEKEAKKAEGNAKRGFVEQVGDVMGKVDKKVQDNAKLVNSVSSKVSTASKTLEKLVPQVKPFTSKGLDFNAKVTKMNKNAVKTNKKTVNIAKKAGEMRKMAKK